MFCTIHILNSDYTPNIFCLYWGGSLATEMVRSGRKKAKPNNAKANCSNCSGRNKEKKMGVQKLRDQGEEDFNANNSDSAP